MTQIQTSKNIAAMLNMSQPTIDEKINDSANNALVDILSDTPRHIIKATDLIMTLDDVQLILDTAELGDNENGE